VNCAALPADLLESELFGHERGAFTGAGATRVGKFEFAQHGTIMLDEIGEMPVALQAKLLHVLQDGEFTRLGSNRPVESDVRIIAATNRDLESMMRAGSFREDLYYRLQVIEIFIPPLRERREEIRPLVDFFLLKFSNLYRRPAPRLSPAVSQALMQHAWPGNIRELENMMKRFVMLQDEGLILGELVRSGSDRTTTLTPMPADPSLPTPMPAQAAAPHATLLIPATAPIDPFAADAAEGDRDEGVDLQSLARSAAMQAERRAIEQALVRFRWNRRKAAEHLKVSYKTLLNKMKECGITAAPDGPS
jgi:two-component system response regulator AtoC